MDWDIKKVRAAFGGKLVGSVFMKTMICETVLIFPSEMIERITGNIWFLSSDDESWAYTFDGNDARDKHFIYLSHELFNENKSQIMYTIAHEIGHVILKHKNSIGRRQTESEIKKQEREADEFAKFHLRNF
jgi:Zn-dependent peptidase ImmA (M78 family)